MASAIVALGACLATFATTAIAQEDDPFAPPPETVNVRRQLAGVKYRLITAGPNEKLNGIDFRGSTVAANGRPIEHDRLKALDQLPSLKVLQFDQPSVADNWLPIVAKCKDLEELCIFDAAITSKGMEALAKLNLRHAVFVKCNKLDDDAMETIADWEKLKVLRLTDVPITDDGVKTLRSLTELESLDLGWNDPEVESRITNRSLETLRGFVKLKKLLIYGTAITDRGVEDLAKALPQCQIGY